MSYSTQTTKTDEEFINVGKKDGILIWRIEEFKVKKVKAQEYGKFYTGDSYLILQTDLGKRVSNIFFWLGAESSIDEYGTCALKAIELDDSLGGAPVQYREVQNHESKMFLSLFEETGLRYLSGGHPSGFNDTKDIVLETKLYMVKGKRDIRIAQVPLSIESLNHSDVFILDDNTTIYQWSPENSSKMEQLKASVFAKKIRDDDHCGKGQLIFMDSDELYDNADFWSLLPGEKDQIKQHSDISDTEFEKSFNSSEISLYRVSDQDSNNNSEAVIELVKTGKLVRDLLDPKDCFIVDSESKGIFCWIGRQCTKREKQTTVHGAQKLMKEKNYPNYVPLSNVIDGGETIAFKSLFKDWVE